MGIRYDCKLCLGTSLKILDLVKFIKKRGIEYEFPFDEGDPDFEELMAREFCSLLKIINKELEKCSSSFSVRYSYPYLDPKHQDIVLILCHKHFEETQIETFIHRSILLDDISNIIEDLSLDEFEILANDFGLPKEKRQIKILAVPNIW